jgi:hypothetical protein
VKNLGDAGVRARLEVRDGYTWLHYPTGFTPGRDALDAVAKALHLHRGARRLAIAIELREAGWTPSPRLAGRWDDPQGKHRDCPAWRALQIARRDNGTA